MYAAFFIYSLSGIFSKLASDQEFLSVPYILCFSGILLAFVIYAVMWQQVLRRIPLSVAMAHKSIVLVLGLCWACLLFGEPLSVNLLVGTAVVGAGITMMDTGDER